jgi:hypothetical protein
MFIHSEPGHPPAATQLQTTKSIAPLGSLARGQRSYVNNKEGPPAWLPLPLPIGIQCRRPAGLPGAGSDCAVAPRRGSRRCAPAVAASAWRVPNCQLKLLAPLGSATTSRPRALAVACAAVGWSVVCGWRRRVLACVHGRPAPSLSSLSPFPARPPRRRHRPA